MNVNVLGAIFSFFLFYIMLLEDFIPVKKNNELVKEPFIRMWMNDSIVVTQNHLIQVFNPELHIVYSHSSKKEFQTKSILKENILFVQQEKLQQIDMESNKVLASTDPVFGLEVLDDELVTIERNGSIKSSKFNVQQNGKVLHCEIVGDRLAIVFQEKSTVVQYFGGNPSQFEIDLLPKPLRFAIGLNCCFILCTRC
jgi:hypothetical protein